MTESMFRKATDNMKNAINSLSEEKRNFLLKYEPCADRGYAWDENQNYKGQLIEYCHSNNLPVPQFNIVNSHGPEHEKTFIVKVVIAPRQSWVGIGSTKKSAEQDGAQRAINFLLGS